MRKILFSLIIFFCSFGASASISVYMNPTAVALGSLDVGLDVQVTDNLTVGPTYFSMNLLTSSLLTTQRIEATGFGGRLSYYFGPVFGDSWVMSAAFVTLPTFKITAEQTTLFGGSGLTGTSDISGANIGLANIGYQWLWSWFSLRFALGLVQYSVESPVTITYSDSTTTSVSLPTSGTSFGGELLVGIVF